MKVLLRILLTFVSTVAALYFTFWVGGAFIFAWHMPPWISFIGSFVVAAVIGRYVWVHTASLQAGIVSSIVLGAVATGGIGFAAGFFGPILFMPGANQGPLLGIFITGPLGFLLGGVGGAVHWFTRGRHAKQARSSAG
jgi:hypothetical protein